MGSRGTQARDGGFVGLWCVSFVGLTLHRVHSGAMGMVGGVSVATGVGGRVGARGSEFVVWSQARESVSPRTRTRPLIVSRTLLMSMLLVVRVDTSFNVDPKRWKGLEAMSNQVSRRGVAS